MRNRNYLATYNPWTDYKPAKLTPEQQAENKKWLEEWQRKLAEYYKKLDEQEAKNK